MVTVGIALAAAFAFMAQLPASHTPQSRERAVTNGSDTESQTQLLNDDTGKAPREPTASTRAASAGIPSVSEVVALPPVGTRAHRKEWVRARFGEAHDELGFFELPRGVDGEDRTPQSLVPTPDGRLLVLDSEKKRLVWYSEDGTLEDTRAIPQLVKPMDVGVSDDGTIVVMDAQGLHTKGTLILNADGSQRGMLPQVPEPIAQMDVIGDSVYGLSGQGTVKLGTLDGTPSHETPGLYDQDGNIPGVVTSDGATVVNVLMRRKQKGVILVTALRGEPPQHLYSRQFQVPLDGKLIGVPLVQTDYRGTLYAAVVDDSWDQVLVCLELETGTPLGVVQVPWGDDPPYAFTFRRMNVDRKNGGVVTQRFTKDGGVIYERFDCR